jgi:hypothetical protein
VDAFFDFFEEMNALSDQGGVFPSSLLGTFVRRCSLIVKEMMFADVR